MGKILRYTDCKGVIQIEILGISNITTFVEEPIHDIILDVDVSDEAQDKYVLRVYLDNDSKVSIIYIDAFILKENETPVRLLESSVNYSWRKKAADWCFKYANVCLEQITKQLELFGNDTRDMQGVWV